MASRSLSDLDPIFRPLAEKLIVQLVEQGIAILIVNTLRSDKEQAQNVANGTSTTLKSKHLSQPPFGLAKAIDLVPFEQYQLHGPDKLNWNDKDPVWAKMGIIGEALGLRWGGRWIKPHDVGHFELIDESNRAIAAVEQKRSVLSI